MKLSTIKVRMANWYRAGISVHLKSAPGRGKTTTIKAAPDIIGRALGKRLGLSIVNGAMLTPMDVLGYGLPRHADNRTEMVFSDPFFIRTEERRRMEEYDGGILFVDEADKADPDVKKVLGEGALSGRFGPHVLAPGWVVWTAGNRAGDRSGSTKELDHLINRRMEIDVTDDFQSWEDYAVEVGVMPATIVFAQENQNIVFADGVPDKQGPWCTPRSLVRMDEYLRAITPEGELPPEDHDTVEEMAGMIGRGPATQYLVTLKVARESPRYEDIIRNPSKTKLPTKPDAQMLVSYSLASKVTIEDAGPAIEYIKRMPKEFAVTFAKSATKRIPMLIKAPAFSAWVRDNASLLHALATI